VDTQKRTVVKAVSWQVMGLVSMTLIAYLFTGSVEGSLGVALSSCATGFVCYFLHERAWAKVAWGVRD
jgi:uncharacterized membrane protein